jgi:hypothetical protein
MQKLILMSAALALLLSVFSAAAFAQEDDKSARNLYLAHASDSKRGRPGVRISIELKRDGATRKVALNYLFRAGDRVKFHFETNFNAYVKIINIGSTGTPQLLYPYRGASELVIRTRDYAIPQGDLWFEFDQNPGTERLTFVFSSQPLLVAEQSRGAANEQRALDDLNSQSLENGKDFNLVQDSQKNEHSAYGVTTTQTLRKPIGVRINLWRQ